MDLNQRQNNETTFYNNQAESFDRNVIYDNFEKITAVENKEALKEFGGKKNIKNKKILDLGCGIGDTAVYFALQGAEVYGVDVSPNMIKTATDLARQYNIVNKCSFSVGVAEKLNFDDNSFDFVFGNGVLHHTDLEPTIKEVYRVLKKNGKAAFIEPLAYNPIINIYRKLATKVRSEDERPLKLKDFKIINKYFKMAEHKEFWFFSLYLFIHFFLTGYSPNKHKYWKKIIKDADKYSMIYRPLKKLDDIILKIIPPLRLLCWTTVIKLTK